jgi:large subunit ribosomal protein L15
MKGQQARAGYKTRPGFEGGQTALIRRLPRRRGFRNPFRVEFRPVNLKRLADLPANSEVTPESLRAAGIVASKREQIKILGDGDLAVALTVRAHRVSASARAKIEAAGGTVEELAPLPPLEERKRKRRIKQRKGEAAAAAAEAASPAEATSEDEESDDSSSESETAGTA